MTQRPERFRPYEHLRRRADFARVFAARRRAGDEWLTVYVAPNRLEVSRLGVSVSRRVGGAVTRNYIRRRLREAFRKNKERLPKGYDVVCVVQPSAADSDADLSTSLLRLARRAAR